MSDEPDSPVLQHLSRIVDRIEQLAADFASMRSNMATMHDNMVLLYFLFERTDERITRIEKRLDRTAA